MNNIIEFKLYENKRCHKTEPSRTYYVLLIKWLIVLRQDKIKNLIFPSNFKISFSTKYNNKHKNDYFCLVM